ncbi:Plexin-B-like protein [Leptotrombidium deliense]|uniref:Plexin-B-like protein n=1 Tax=Leptotrombidium deliense TaxID=299467 RepID=A0A443SIB4_9ACAR|nr:Plexin-B-like protein [Leptotrombidium deliense]
METSQCIHFEEIRPSHVPITTNIPLDLVIQQLPSYGSTYLCIFGNSSSPIAARVTFSGLSCATPPIQERPAIPKGQGNYC